MSVIHLMLVFTSNLKTKKTVEVETVVLGCKKCKTQFGGNFCSICGSRKTMFTITKKESLQTGYDYMNFIEDHVDGECFDLFYGSEYSLFATPTKQYYYNSLDNSYEERIAIDFTDAQRKLEEFKEEYKNILYEIGKYDIDFEVVYGVIAMAR